MPQRAVQFLARLRSRWTVFLHDVLWVPTSILLAYAFRFNFEVPSQLFRESALILVATAIPLHAAAFWILGCYRGIWRFASIPDFVRLAKAVSIAALTVVVAVFLVNRLAYIPRAVLVFYPLLVLGGVAGARVLYRTFTDRQFRFQGADSRRALLIGAGRAGEVLLRNLVRHGPYVPICIADDDRQKAGVELHGVRVRGAIGDVPALVKAHAIDVILIATPSASREQMEKILDVCAETGLPCRTLPDLVDLSRLPDFEPAARLRPVTVEDLLGRESVDLNDAEIDQFLRGRTVVVTGGGGSIGSELCRQIAGHRPRELIVLDNSEFNLYQLEQQLQSEFADVRIRYEFGDVRNANAVDKLFDLHRPDVVFHAAAYKHVPMVERNIVEGVRNNVMGTRVVADAAIRCGTGKVVLISTDKTVNPSSVMGASKRVAELYCQNLAQEGQTQFVTTRFGNVLGSCGSVVPLFERQIEQGGPVTITHPDVTRYFMTIREATGLILQAAAMGNGGEIYVLDMGQPVRIRKLAERMIQLSGRRVGHDIEIRYIGLRPGEKLHEELFYDAERLLPTRHPKLRLAESRATDRLRLQAELDRLAAAVDAGDPKRVLAVLGALIPEYSVGSSPATGDRPLRLVR